MSKIKYVSPKDVNELNAIQDRAIKGVHRARDLVQIALVATIIHTAKHNDYSGAQRLVEGVGNAANGAAMVEFFVRFGGLLVSEDGKGFGGWQGPEYIKNNLDDAKATMWWELKKANPFKGYNAEAEIQRLIKNYKAMQTKASELPDEDKDKINLTISDESIKALLSLANFEAIITGGDAVNETEVSLSDVA